MSATVLPKGTRPSARQPWTVRSWTDDGTKQHEKSFATQQEARSYATELNAAAESGQTVDPRGGRETFGASAQRWIDTRRPATRDKYAGILRVHLQDIAGRKLSAVANDRDGVQTLTVSHPQGKAMLAVIRSTCDAAVHPPARGRVSQVRC